MKINKLNEALDHPYMFQYSCNNSTFGDDFQRYAQELGARRMYDHTQKGGGLHFYTVPSEDVYNKLKEVAKKRFIVDMYPIRPFDKERYANAKVQEAMTIAYDENSIKEQIRILNKNIEDYKQLIIDEPEDKEYWEEMIKKCKEEIADLSSYESINEASERPLYIIRDSHGNQLSAPNPDDEELWDRVASMEARGRRGLCVVVYTGKLKESLIGKKVQGTNSYGKPVGMIGTVVKENPNDRDRYGNYSITVQYEDGSIKTTRSFWVHVLDEALKEDVNEIISDEDNVELRYSSLDFIANGPTKFSSEYGYYSDEFEDQGDVVLTVSREDIITYLWEEKLHDFLDNADDMQDDEIEKYIKSNFESLINKYEADILNAFEENAREQARQDYENSLFESNQRFYVTTYRLDSVSGPEEGGYTSYGWMPTHSKYFPSVEDARKEMLARIEDDDEIISQDEDRIYVKDSYGDEYVVAVEPASKRGRTEEPPRTWAEAEFDDPTPRTYFDRNGSPLDHNPYARRKAEKQQADLMRRFMDELDNCHTRDEVLDVYSNAPHQVQLDAIAEVVAKLKEIDGNLNEAHYGGAFDIEDDQYFTREEIDEFGYELVDTLNTLGYNKFDYNGGYVDGNVLGILIYWADGEVTVEQIIDMRKIKTPSDLSRKYLGAMVEKAKIELEKIGADFGPHLNGQDYPIDEDFADDEVIYLDLIPEPTLKASNVKFSHELAKELDDMFRENNLWVQELHYNPVENQIEFDINWGDWKHEHLRAKWLINDFFESKKSWVKINSWTTEEDGSDAYSAHYEIYNKS